MVTLHLKLYGIVNIIYEYTYTYIFILNFQNRVCILYINKIMINGY